MNASGTPQSMLHQVRGEVPSNRDRSFEQRNSNSGNPMMPIFNTTFPTYGTQYTDPYGGQSPNLGRYIPPTISNASSGGNPSWNNNMGGYSYNLPNAYGGYQGTALYGQQNWLQDYLAQGGPKPPQFAVASKPMQMPPTATPPQFGARTMPPVGAGRLPPQMPPQMPPTPANDIASKPAPQPGIRPQLSAVSGDQRLPIVGPPIPQGY